MTLSQRLTRAGLVFVLFGSVVSLLPTNGTATAATNYTPPSTGETVGLFAGDTTKTYPTTMGSVTLTAFSDSGATAVSATDVITGADTGTFTTTVTGNQVKTTTTLAAGSTATDQVTVTFSNSRTVTYTVTVGS